MKSLRLLLAVFLCVMTLVTSGCSSLILKMQADFVAPIVSEMVDQGTTTESVNVIREGIAANIIMLSALTRISPYNLTYLQKASFTYCAYGMMVEEQDPAFAAELYSLGKKYGMRGLQTNSAFRKGLQQGQPIPEITGELSPKYTEAICWTALNTGLWILMNMDDAAALVQLADAMALAKRSIELDADYFYGVSKAFLAAYYAFVPEFFGTGGGPKASQQMFDAARAASDGRLLLVDVFEARFLKTQLKDREGFEKQLESVIAADPDILKEGAIMTQIAKIKAQYYLDHMDEYF